MNIRLKNGVASHVDLSLLFDRARDCGDRDHARMIDGRTIHQFILLVERTLRELEPAAFSAPSGEPMLRRRACRSLEASGYFRARSHPDLEIPIFLAGLPFGSVELARLQQRIAAAERQLRAVGLHFFVELGLGAIVGTLSWGVVSPIPGVGALVLDASDPAESLLGSAARSFLSLVIEAEAGVAGVAEPLRGLACLGLVDLFSWSVVHEYRVRLGTSEGDGREAEAFALSERLLPWMEANSWCRLAQELVCCWYPGWHRVLFIYDSPLDHLVSLQPAGAVGAAAISTAKE